LYLAENGFRAIAHDRRGHGRSAQVWDGNDMDHLSAVPPFMLRTDDNPGGVPIEVFDEIRAGSLADRSQL
jgi:non-heme chloroperoxidase